VKTRIYQVKDVARLAGVSARTLRHYDQIGLLVPSNRSDAGYRLYNDADLLRLQQIMIGRALGLTLEDIRKLIDDPQLDREKLLQQQREALIAQVQATNAMIRSVDAALELLRENTLPETSTMDMAQIFDGFDPAQYEQEAQDRWGNTESYKESARRIRAYSADDWRQIKSETKSIMEDAAAALRATMKPDDLQVMDIAERHRLWIDRWFYACSPSMHAALADMYEADERFARNIDKFAAGLTPFWSAAVRMNAKCRIGSLGNDATGNRETEG
jgi:DNA-binding transcriptional MerR regulator